MNPPESVQSIQTLCECLFLGEVLQVPRTVTGGFHHTLWHVYTSSGEYAIKQLAADTDLSQQNIVDHYNQSEAVANGFKASGVPAVAALSFQGSYLQQLEQQGFLVYPWQRGRAVPASDLSEGHLQALIPLVARMHLADIQVEGVGKPEIEIHSEQAITTHVENASCLDRSLSDVLHSSLPLFFQIAADHASGLELLAQQRVISHGDLDTKNVLWDGGDQPFIIDWESARQLNPTFEILQIALDWSGITEQFDAARFQHIIALYRCAGAELDRDHVSAALDCICGDWLNWLIYNLDRACDWHAELRPLGTSQLELVLPTLLRIHAAKAEIKRILHV